MLVLGVAGLGKEFRFGPEGIEVAGSALKRPQIPHRRLQHTILTLGPKP